VIHPTQTAFVQGIYILDEVVTLHEIVQELHRENMNGDILKIDFKNMIKFSGIFFSEM
jgi:hypothetical protein